MSAPVLLLINFQKGFERLAAGQHRSNIEAEGNAMRLLEAWRDRQWPVIHVRHDSAHSDSVLRAGTPGNAPMSFAAELPGETVVRKTVNSAFIGTALAEKLDALGRPEVVVAGASTDHCVSSTIRMGADLGYRMTLAVDACFAFDRFDTESKRVPAEEVQRVTVASLAGQFARIGAAAALSAELSRARRAP